MPSQNQFPESNVTPPEQLIAVTKLPLSTSFQCLPSRFGALSFSVEAAIFSCMRRLAETYNGGHWEFYELSNGGFYMAPKSTNLFTLLSTNGFSADVSPDAAGIVATLFALSHLSFQVQSEALGDHYHHLLAYAMQHAEAGVIVRLID